ncbi:MAG: UDP-N-acetylglucosamine 4,6-dehydratase (inverting) [Planctomycetota bacterium]
MPFTPHGSNILVTGGTGTFGKAFIRHALEHLDPERLVVFSRDELKQHEMRTSGFDDPRLRYFIGDVRDETRLRRAMSGVDVVVHAAALKQVPACEYNPFEAIMTNVMGARNVVEASIDAGVKRVIALSTDKAVAPVNLYGATKLCSEKLFTQSNAYASGTETVFANVRYGNVLGSRGSVIPLFKKQRETGVVTVTHPEMTRFWLRVEQGVDLVVKAMEMTRGGEIFVPKIPSMRIVDLAHTIAPDCNIEFIGVRPGEKLHETMISADESRQTLELDDLFIVEPEGATWHRGASPLGRRVAEGFTYVSDTNDQWITGDQLRVLAGEPARAA